MLLCSVDKHSRNAWPERLHVFDPLGCGRFVCNLCLFVQGQAPEKKYLRVSAVLGSQGSKLDTCQRYDVVQKYLWLTKWRKGR